MANQLRSRVADPREAAGRQPAELAVRPHPVAHQARHLVREAAGVATAFPLFAAAPLVRRWHLRWGATCEEVAAAMPGDDLVPVSNFTATRAVTIDAPPAAVWPWLVQVGFGRAGFYSNDLLDNLGRASAEAVRPELQQLDVGDVAAPMANPPTEDTSFRVHEPVPGRTLVWAKPHSSWAWTLTPAGTRGTRLVTRLRQQYTAHTSTLLTVLLCEFGDFPMMRKMLLGLKRRAEQHTPALPAARHCPGGDHDRPQSGTGGVAPAVPGLVSPRSPRHKNDGSEQT